VLSDGRRLATIDGWADHPQAFAGIDLGSAGGLRSLESLLPGAGGAARAAAEPRDWLADFMDDATPETPVGDVRALAADAASGPAAPDAPAVAGPAWLPGALDHGFPVDASDEGWDGREHGRQQD
jgi:hypothetical protein